MVCWKIPRLWMMFPLFPINVSNYRKFPLPCWFPTGLSPTAMFGLFPHYTPEIQRGTACYSWGLLTWTYGTVSSGFCSPGNHATNFFNKITQKLTWNPMQAQTEPKLHPETANMEFEQVITKRSATLKGDLKVNLEPKWFLRRFPWKFHVSDFRATLLFTSYCAHVLITIRVPGLWWGKNWNQNTSKKRSWLIFGYVLGSVFVAQPSNVSRNRQKTWQRREKKQATW